MYPGLRRKNANLFLQRTVSYFFPASYVLKAISFQLSQIIESIYFTDVDNSMMLITLQTPLPLPTEGRAWPGDGPPYQPPAAAESAPASSHVFKCRFYILTAALFSLALRTFQRSSFTSSVTAAAQNPKHYSRAPTGGGPTAL